MTTDYNKYLDEFRDDLIEVIRSKEFPKRLNTKAMSLLSAKEKTKVNRQYYAQVSAAVKRVKRSFVFDHFDKIRELNPVHTDFTVRNIHYAIKAVLGRSCDFRAICKRFGTPDRLADDKSNWHFIQVKKKIDELKIELDKMLPKLSGPKETCRLYAYDIVELPPEPGEPGS